MKDDFLHKGIQGIKKIRLSPEESGVVLSRILEHINENPAVGVIPKRLRVSNWFTRSYGPAGFGRQISGFRFEYAMAGILAVFIAGGSAVSAAETSLPGDILYPVKIFVNEPVRGALIQGDVPKARWESERTVRRLEEAESLAAEGRLNRASVESIRENFEKSADEFDSRIQSSESRGPSEETVNERIDFEARMKAHSQILETMEEKTKISQEDGITPLRDAVEEKARHAWRGRVDTVEVFLRDSEGRGRTGTSGREVQRNEQRAEMSAGEDASRETFDARAQSVETAIRGTEDGLRNAAVSEGGGGPSVQKDILENIPETLKTAGDALREAREKRDSGDSSEAFSALIDSETAAKKADISLKQGLRLGEEEKGRGRGGRGRSRGSEQPDNSANTSSKIQVEEIQKQEDTQSGGDRRGSEGGGDSDRSGNSGKGGGD